MTHSSHSHIRLLNRLKSYSSRKRATWQDYGIKDSDMHLALLSALSTMMSIAQNLGLKVSIKFSKKKE